MTHIIQTTLAASVFAIAASLVAGCSTTTAAATSPGSHTIVTNDYEGARSAAVDDGRLLLVNSTGYNAGNARIMEVKTFKDPLVAEALTQFVEARLYGDASDPAARESNQRAIEAVAHGPAVPQYVALDPATGEELGHWMGMTQEAADFAEFLNEAAMKSR